MFRHIHIILREFYGWSGVYMPDQHTNNINKVLHKQPQIHAACTRDNNVQKILLHH